MHPQHNSYGDPRQAPFAASGAGGQGMDPGGGASPDRRYNHTSRRRPRGYGGAVSDYTISDPAGGGGWVGDLGQASAEAVALGGRPMMGAASMNGYSTQQQDTVMASPGGAYSARQAAEYSMTYGPHQGSATSNYGGAGYLPQQQPHPSQQASFVGNNSTANSFMGAHHVNGGGSVGSSSSSMYRDSQQQQQQFAPFLSQQQQFLQQQQQQHAQNYGTATSGGLQTAVAVSADHRMPPQSQAPSQTYSSSFTAHKRPAATTDQGAGALNGNGHAPPHQMNPNNYNQHPPTMRMNQGGPGIDPSAAMIYGAGATASMPGMGAAVARRTGDRPLIRLSVALIDSYRDINNAYYASKTQRRAERERQRQVSEAAAAAAAAAQQQQQQQMVPPLLVDPQVASVAGQSAAVSSSNDPSNIVAANASQESASSAAGVSHSQWDDDNYDYVINEGELFYNRYIIKERIGRGSFGQVIRAKDTLTKRDVAIKIIKSRKPFRIQAQTEIELLTAIKEHDVEDGHNIVRLEEHFMFRNHQCLVFELLSLNLYELLRNTQFSGVSLNLIRKFGKQILKVRSLSLMALSVVHSSLGWDGEFTLFGFYIMSYASRHSPFVSFFYC
jgi:hypothetical protein